jgi:prophage regulatory protein
LAGVTVKILRFKTVSQSTGYPHSTLYRHIKNGIFPPPVQIGPQTVGWIAEEVEAVMTARAVGEDSEEIRKLVCKLKENRKTYKRFDELDAHTANPVAVEDLEKEVRTLIAELKFALKTLSGVRS